MSEGFEVVVVGAGPNGLTAACCLAKRGRRVLVLERRDVVGGLASADEFQPGYRSPGLYHDSSGVRPRVLEALELERFGLRRRRRHADLLALAGDGESLLLAGDRYEAAKQIGKRSARDADRVLEFQRFVDDARSVLGHLLDRPPIDPVFPEAAGRWTLARHAFRLRRLGQRKMTELLRVPPMCVADWLDEWFESEPLKAALALPALAGTFMGPRSPGGAANLLFHEVMAGAGIHGGGPALTSALERCARDSGVEIRLDAGVGRIDLGPHAVRGVVLDGGERIDAPAVALSCDPKQAFLRLLPAGAIADRLERRIKNLRARGTTAQLLLALDSPLELAGRTDPPLEHAVIVRDLNGIERAHDAVKYRECSEVPALELHQPAQDAGLAPPGHAVVSVLVHFAPYDLAAGWDDAQRERLADSVQQILEDHLPGIGSRVVGRRLLCPKTIESQHGVSGGHLHHLEHGLDQLLIRPAPGCTQYRTPIPGLYLCGSGSHPGGGLTCAPGALAAAEMLA